MPTGMLLRFFALPTLVIVTGFVLMAALGRLQSVQLAVGLVEAFRWPLLALIVGGFVWFLWRVWLLYRWEQGQLAGGCNHCGGPMKQLDGRYGAYSKCMMCGSKRGGKNLTGRN